MASKLPSRAQFLSSLRAPTGDLTGTICGICLQKVDEMEPSQVIQVHKLHIFCSPCIRTWLEKNATCPYCRVELFTARQPIPDTPQDSSYLSFLVHTQSQQHQALRWEADLAGSETHFRLFLAALQRRGDLYLNDRLNMDWTYGNISRRRTSAPIFEDEVYERLRDIMAVTSPTEASIAVETSLLATGLWIWFFARFSHPVLGYSPYQHPLASAFLFEMIRLLKLWQGEDISSSSVQEKLEAGYRHWMDMNGILRGPEGWDGVRGEMIDVVRPVHGSGVLKHFLTPYLRFHEALLR